MELHRTGAHDKPQQTMLFCSEGMLCNMVAGQVCPAAASALVVARPTDCTTVSRALLCIPAIPLWCGHWSLHWGLSPGPSVYKTDALPLSYRGYNKNATFSTIHHFTIFVYELTLMRNCIGLVPMTNHSRHCLFVVKACCATLWLAKRAQLQRPH